MLQVSRSVWRVQGRSPRSFGQIARVLGSLVTRNYLAHSCPCTRRRFLGRLVCFWVLPGRLGRVLTRRNPRHRMLPVSEFTGGETAYAHEIVHLHHRFGIQEASLASGKSQPCTNHPGNTHSTDQVVFRTVARPSPRYREAPLLLNSIVHKPLAVPRWLVYRS